MIGIGQLGVGAMAQARAAALHGKPDARVVAVWSRQEPNRDAFAKLTGARPANDWRAVVDDPAVQGVCVATPTCFHAEMALAAIAAGKHVLVECPVTGELAQFNAMLDAARRAGVVFYPGSNYRFSPAAQAVESASQRIGQVFLARADSTWQPGQRSWFFERTMSGGLFPCVHLYQFTLFHCLGAAQWVEASFIPGAPCGVATVRYESGALGVATGGLLPQGTNDLVLLGAEGMLRAEPNGDWVIQRTGGVEPVGVTTNDPTEADNAAFLAGIRGEVDWRPHAQRERAIHAIAIAAQRSAEEGKRVALSGMRAAYN